MKIINLDIKRCVTQDGVADPIYVDYNTLTRETFLLRDGAGKPVTPDESQGFYFAGSTKMSPISGELLWMCNDFELEGNRLTFKNIDTYTTSYLSQIKKKGTLINVEVGVMTASSKQVLLRDFGYASPRVYIDGLDPHDIELGQYYTKQEVDEMLSSFTPASVGEGTLTLTQGETVLGTFNANAFSNSTIDIPGGGSDVTSAYVEEKIEEHDEAADAHSALFAGKQDIITSEKKLSYALISGAPSIPTKTSDLTNDVFIPSSLPIVVGNVSNDGGFETADNVFIAKQVNLSGVAGNDVVIGRSTTNLSGNYNVIIGSDFIDSNTVLGYSNTVIGTSNILSGNNIIAVGSNNIGRRSSSTSNSVLVGTNLSADMSIYSNGLTVLGQYNAPAPNGTTLILGAGRR